jgi:hypothetical protein
MISGIEHVTAAVDRGCALRCEWDAGR